MIRTHARRALLATVLTVAAAGTDHASAQTEEAPGPAQARPQQVPRPSLLEFGLPRGDGRGPFALLLHVGSYAGFGGGVAVGTPAAGLRVSVGWSPMLAVLRTESSGGTSDDLKFYSGLQISPDLYAAILHPRPTTHVGLQGGYRYSSLFGHGVAGGGYAEFALSRAFDALVTIGLVVYPDGEDRLRENQNLPTQASFSFPGPSVNFGVSFGLAFFP